MSAKALREKVEAMKYLLLVAQTDHSPQSNNSSLKESNTAIAATSAQTSNSIQAKEPEDSNTTITSKPRQANALMRSQSFKFGERASITPPLGSVNETLTPASTSSIPTNPFAKWRNMRDFPAVDYQAISPELSATSSQFSTPSTSGMKREREGDDTDSEGDMEQPKTAHVE